MTLHSAMARRVACVVKSGAFAFALLIFMAVARPASAETPAETCNRLAGDAIPLDSINGQEAVTACSAAVTTAPQDKQLQYEYARALEHNAQRDQAKQIYQWIAQDGYAPATAALARMTGPLTGEAAEREKFAQKLDAIAAIAARVAKSIPRDHDDPNTVLAQTGKDPAKILAWVKANTRIMPYAGMLRGASGVLMDRVGNSLDRALLLAELLHRAGNNVRIARAQISPLAAEALRVRFVNSAPKPTPSPAPDKAALLKQVGGDPRLDPKLVEKAVDDTIAGAQKFSAETQTLYGKVLPAVLQAIGNDPTRDAKLAADADAVLRDHFWVQRQNGAGWDDLDPDADVVAKPVATATFVTSAIPENLKQRVTLRLTVETLKDGKLSETPILQQSWLPPEVAGKPIVISHSLYPQLPLDGLLKRPDPQSDFIQGLTDATVVMPTLQVGAQVIRGQLYDFKGQVQAPTPTNLASMGGTAMVNGQSLARGIASAFGDSTPAPTQPSQAMVTAEWLEIDVAVPGVPLEKHRRAIFDLIGAASRANPASIAAPEITDDLRKQRALSLSATIDGFVFGATPAADWIQRTTMDGTAQALTSTATAARTAQSLATPPSQPVARIEPQLWGWAANRVASSLLPGSMPISPNVALLWEMLPPQTGAPNHLQVAFDIVANGAARDTSFAQRVAQGVMDTVMEDSTLGGSGANAAAQYADDLTAGKSWTLYKTDTSAQAEELPISDEAKSQLRAALSQGDWVIAPAGAASADLFTWWRIDPRTGLTLGIGTNGMGTTMVEEALMLAAVANASACATVAIGSAIANRVWVGASAMVACNWVPGFGAAALGQAGGSGQTSPSDVISFLTADVSFGIKGGKF